MTPRTAPWLLTLALGCSSPSGQAPPPPEARAQPPRPQAPEPRPPPARLADPTRVPFEIRVGETTAVVAEGDRAWIDLGRAAFTDLSLRYTLRASALDLPGLPLVQLIMVPAPDGRSGMSYTPSALLRWHGGAWTFVHVNVALPGASPGNPVAALADARLRIGECDPDAQRAVLATALGQRPPVVEARCRPLDDLVSAGFLAEAREAALVARTHALLERLTQALRAGRSFRIADRRTDVPRDVTWLPGGAFVPWQVARQGDVVTASGLFLFGRTWYRFALRVDARLTLEATAVALASTHGDPP